MYVEKGTTQKEILNKIRAIEEELDKNKKLTGIDRIALHNELDYLYSFIADVPEV